MLAAAPCSLLCRQAPASLLLSTACRRWGCWQHHERGRLSPCPAAAGTGCVCVVGGGGRDFGVRRSEMSKAEVERECVRVYTMCMSARENIDTRESESTMSITPARNTPNPNPHHHKRAHSQKTHSTAHNNTPLNPTPHPKPYYLQPCCLHPHVLIAGALLTPLCNDGACCLQLSRLFLESCSSDPPGAVVGVGGDDRLEQQPRL